MSILAQVYRLKAAGRDCSFVQVEGILTQRAGAPYRAISATACETLIRITRISRMEEATACGLNLANMAGRPTSADVVKGAIISRCAGQT